MGERDTLAVLDRTSFAESYLKDIRAFVEKNYQESPKGNFGSARRAAVLTLTGFQLMHPVFTPKNVGSTLSSEPHIRLAESSDRVPHFSGEDIVLEWYKKGTDKKHRKSLPKNRISAVITDSAVSIGEHILSAEAVAQDPTLLFGPFEAELNKEA